MTHNHLSLVQSQVGPHKNFETYMTRINSSIKVSSLTDEHLLAEHREIKRLPSIYKKRLESNKDLSELPKKFTLGKGHVLFFINKGVFTLNRYLDILNECIKRGFNVEDYRDNWQIYNISEDYKPTENEHQLLVERISTRLLNSPKSNWRYYGKPISKEDAVKLLDKK